MKIDKNHRFVLETTGRVLEANRSIIGLGVENEYLESFGEAGPLCVFAGYDQGLSFDDDHGSDFNEHATDEEKRELAVHMMRRWAKYGGIEITNDTADVVRETIFDLDLSKEKG